jgi:hypothetical protein
VVCVAILGEGWTDVLKFFTEREAFLHPVVQYGDALICGADDVSALYNRAERPRLLAKLGLPPASADGAAWRLLQQVAAVPPEDYTTVRAMVVRNRLSLRKAKKMSVEDTENMVAAEQEEKRKRGGRRRAKPEAAQEAGQEASAQTEEGGEGEVNRAAPRAPRAPMPENTVLRYAEDPEGRPWSPNHMPCRTGTARYEKFSRFTDGMTVGELRAKNIPHALIHAYVDRGWIRPEGLVPATQATVAVENPNEGSEYPEDEAA